MPAANESWHHATISSNASRVSIPMPFEIEVYKDLAKRKHVAVELPTFGIRVVNGRGAEGAKKCLKAFLGSRKCYCP
jgi:hypothetical protein